MKCPVCKGTDYKSSDFHAEGFSEDLEECNICGATWSIQHGLRKVVLDPQEHSFLAAVSECVEGDDYNNLT